MILGVLIPLLIFAFCAWLIWKAIRASPPGSRRPGRAEHEAPVCGHCAYPAMHVTTLQCPECGADYRQVGIIPPGTRLGVTLPMKLVGWSVVVAMLGGVLGGFLAETILPHRSVRDSIVRLKNASSGLVESVQIRAVSTTYHLPDQYDKPYWSSGICTLMLFLSDGETSVARIDLVRANYSLQLPDGTDHEFQAAFDDVAYQKWFELLGTTLDEATFGDEAIVTLLEIDEIRSYLAVPSQVTGTRSTTSMFGSTGGIQNGFTGGGSSSVSGTGGIAMVFSVPLILLWIALWLLGIIRIVKRGRLF